MNWIIVTVVLLMAHEECMANPTPLKLPGHTQKFTPYIKHWEAANFDRNQLHAAHEKHIEQKRHRRKRHLRINEYIPVHTIKISFSAHDREFRLILRQDPLSVFASDVHIENTEGPLHYDISRVYTGTLEDEENSYVHAVLTNDNLLDGTIETYAEHFYIEPSYRYSSKLSESGIHSIIYRVSDVDMRPRDKTKSMPIAATAEHCASERLKRSVLFDQMKRRMSNGEEFRLHNTWKLKGNDNENILQARERFKRWLPEELSLTGDGPKGDPSLPLDLEVPYNDDLTYFSNLANTKTISTITTTTMRNLFHRHMNTTFDSKREQSLRTHQASVITWRNSVDIATAAPTTATLSNKYNRNRNVIIKNFNNLNNSEENNNNNNNIRKTYTKHKNIIVSTYNKNDNSNNNNNNRSPFNDRVNDFSDSSQNGVLFNNNWTTIFMGSGNNDRPIHKTHVEIITKNGATKKPNIIVNNYNPDIVVAPNPHHPNFNSMLMTNLLTNRGSSSGTDGMDDSGAGKSLYDRKITCMLYLQADHTFFQKMGSDEASIEAITRHVQRANSIYKNTDFNNDGKPDNITFMIKRIKVHNMNAIKDPSYRFPGNYGVEKFLELFSEEDYDAFCLAYMFTYRDFEMGTLGLAWTGDLKNAGGVCEKNGHYRGSLKSLNTGIVTLLNYGKHVPPAVSHVTLAHEIGHNFGSPHDPEQCTPGGEDGNYIMFARATSGDKKNNNKFSPCSLKSIEPVLNAKARSSKGCFTEPQTSICGNGVVEPGEECDCGWEEDCKDSCCFPMSRHPRNGEKPCTLTPKAMCSPSQGPCCTADCKLKYGDKCRDDNGCRDPSFCNGRMPQCPPSVNKPNKTICNKEFVCFMGECTGSICLAYGLESCQCIPGPQDDKIKSCELCCKLPGEDNPCRSSFEWNESPFDVPDMYAKPGTPCNDYNGYCDVFQKCREVDPSGPLATLRKLLLSEESIATFKKWIQQNWYTVVLAGVGVFILLIISTKLLAKRSNLKLKSVTIIHSATTETVRLPDDNNGVIVHTAIRTKVPLKRKVRGERNASNNNGSSQNNIASSGNKSKLLTSGSNNNKNLLKMTNNQLKLGSATFMTNRTILKKSIRNKSKRFTATNSVNPLITGVEKTNNVKAESTKKLKKSKKSNNKEIIDYSSTRGGRITSSSGQHNNNNNTLGKVQKWLLESPIVAQPLCYNEHSSKMRKVMSKSQSTPERLVQKTPIKSKSTGNLNNDKVKLQVVYKPPFKFALRLSKNSKLKTHIISNNNQKIAKTKRNIRTVLVKDTMRSNNCGQRLNCTDGAMGGSTTAAGVKSLGEKTKRAALLLRGHNDEDNQILTLNEPNYETLNPKTAPSKMENPFYENVNFSHSPAKRNSDPNIVIATNNNHHQHKSNKSNGSLKVGVTDTRSSSHKPSASQGPANATLTQHQHQHQQQHFPLPSNNTADPFTDEHAHSSYSKLSETNVNELSRNFGSTQNLIQSPPPPPHQNVKSKKRSSLNLKTNLMKNSKDSPTKRSNSNMHLRAVDRTSLETSTAVTTVTANVGKSIKQQPLRRSISSTTHQQHQQHQQHQSSDILQTPAALLTSKSLLFNNGLPSSVDLVGLQASNQRVTRASCSNMSKGLSLMPSSSSSHTTNNGNNNFKSTQQQQRFSRNNIKPPIDESQPQRSNSVRQYTHNYHPPPPPSSSSPSSPSTPLSSALPDMYTSPAICASPATTAAAASSNNSHFNANSNNNINNNGSKTKSKTDDLEILMSSTENSVS